MGRCLPALVAGVVLIAGVGAAPQLDFAAADARTLRLPPSAFGDLPAAVRADLERRGCTVPQPFVRRRGPENVIRGRFLSAMPTDVAVLCSRHRRSTILVYRDSAAPAAAELAPSADVDWLQVVDAAGTAGYSRALYVAAPDHIRRHNPDARLPIDRDGIEEAFLEKGSTIRLWSGRAWIELPGSD
jgi:hypothetical protein